jgi:putative hemolysin
MSLVDVLVVLVLLAVNALYVAAEFAAVSTRRSRIRQLAEDGHRLAVHLLPVLEHPQRLDRYIATSQVGITLSSLLLGAYGQATMAVDLAPHVGAWLGLDAAAAWSVSSVGVLLVLTALQVLFGELMPKSVALQYPTPLALATYWPMRWTLATLGWFINFLNGSALLLLRLLRRPETGHRHIHSPEEIELLIAESRDGGLLEPDEHVRLQRALRFSLRTARQLMIPRDQVSALDIRTPIRDVYARAMASPYTRFPVFDGSLDRVVGILNSKPLLLRRLAGNAVTDLRDVLRPPLFVNERLTGDRLVALLRERRAHQAIVQDGSGHVIGVVSLEYLLRELLTSARSAPATGYA